MTYLVVWESSALIPYKAAEERHWDKAEEDDEEDRPTDDSLRFWATRRNKQKEMQCQSKATKQRH